MRYITIAGMMSLGLLAAGCNDDEQVLDPFPEGIESIWAKMFAPYGLYPLFPVRTGVQPGDVAVLCKRPPPIVPDGSDQKTAAVQSSTDSKENSEAKRYEWRFLFSLNGIQQALEEHAKSRMAYLSFQTPSPKTTPEPLGPVVGTAEPYAIGAVGASVGLASFPAVLSYTDRGADVGASLPVGTVAAAAGSSRRAFSSYILEVPTAEFVDLPYALLQITLKRTIENPPAAVQLSLEQLGQALKDNKTCLSESLSVVGSVYYSRNITVSMGDSYANALSARAAYQLPKDSTRKKIYDALGQYTTSENDSKPPNTPIPSSDNSASPGERDRFEKLMLDMNFAYQNAGNNSNLGFAGVRFGFSEAAGKGISMDYKYALPVAFGMRMYKLKFDPTGIKLSEELPLTGSVSHGVNHPVPYSGPGGFGKNRPSLDNKN